MRLPRTIGQRGSAHEQSIAVGFNPLTDLTNPVGAWRAYDQGLSVGNNLVSFTDSINSNDLTDISATPPTYQTSKIAKGAIRFVKASSTYARGVFALDHTTVGKRFYIVAYIDAGFAWGDPILDGNGTSDDMRVRVKTTEVVGLFSGTGVDKTVTGLMTNKAALITGVFDGASSSISINNEADTTGSITADDATGLTLGANNVTTPNGFISMDLCEVYICDAAQGATEHQDMKDWINTEHGIW